MNKNNGCRELVTQCNNWIFYDASTHADSFRKIRMDCSRQTTGLRSAEKGNRVKHSKCLSDFMKFELMVIILDLSLCKIIIDMILFVMKTKYTTSSKEISIPTSNNSDVYFPNSTIFSHKCRDHIYFSCCNKIINQAKTPFLATTVLEKTSNSIYWEWGLFLHSLTNLQNGRFVIECMRLPGDFYSTSSLFSA